MRNLKFKILIGLTVLIVGIVLFFSLSDGTMDYLWNLRQDGGWFLLLVVVAALIDSINPCALSVLLLTIAFLFSLGRLRKDILKIGGVYIFGIFTVYVLIGLGILRVLDFFNIPNFMARLGALLVITLGVITLLNHFFPQFPLKLKIPAVAHSKMAKLMHQASLPTAFGLGVLVALFEFPCTGGPYLMILGLLHDSETYILGFWYLLLYNLIFVLPLIVILLIAANETVLDKIKAWKKQESSKMNLIGGILMIGLGLLILFM